VLEFLQGPYFQEPARFCDVLTALFAQGSGARGRLLGHGRCVLEFEQYRQSYRIPCDVTRLAPRTRATRRPTGQPAVQRALAATSSAGVAPDWAQRRRLSRRMMSHGPGFTSGIDRTTRPFGACVRRVLRFSKSVASPG